MRLSNFICAARDVVDYRTSSQRSCFPLSVTIEPTYSCNLRCKMCNLWKIDSKTLGGKKLLATHEVKKLLENLRDLGTLEVTFIGGEPFTRSGLLDWVAHAVSLGLTATVTTNGTLIDEKKADEIVKSGLQKITFSIDSQDEAVHDDIRGVSGTFQRAVNGIKSLISAKKRLGKSSPRISIGTTISKMNFLDMDKMVDLAADLDVNGVSFGFVSGVPGNVIKETDALLGLSSYSGQFTNRSLFLIDEEYRKFQGVIEKVKAKSLERNVNTNIDSFIREFNYPETLCKGKRKVAIKCLYLWIEMTISPHGDVYPCPMIDRYIIGNVKEMSPDDLWNHQRYQEIRRLLNKGSLNICHYCCRTFISPKDLISSGIKKLVRG